MSDPRPDDLLSYGEIAELTGLATSTLRAYRAADPPRMPPPDDTRYTRVPRWRRDTIEAWLKNRPGKGWRAGDSSKTDRPTAAQQTCASLEPR